MGNLNVDEAFKAFHIGNLSEIDFIPNVKELKGEFTKALEGTCCKSRRRVIMEQHKLFREAFLAATQ